MKLSNGFDAQVDANAVHDWEFVEAVCEIDQGNTTKLPTLFNALLGEKQKKALVAYLRETTGKCTVEQMSETIVEIFSLLKESEKK